MQPKPCHDGKVKLKAKVYSLGMASATSSSSMPERLTVGKLAALADVSAMGAVMIPMMKKEGYDADYAVNVTTHASLVGALMPTSHNLIIFTLATTGIASVSVLTLIVACLIPALILTLCNLAAAYGVAVQRGYPTRGAFVGWLEV
eukprot:gene6277-8327_t